MPFFSLFSIHCFIHFNKFSTVWNLSLCAKYACKPYLRLRFKYCRCCFFTTCPMTLVTHLWPGLALVRFNSFCPRENILSVIFQWMLSHQQQQVWEQPVSCCNAHRSAAHYSCYIKVFSIILPFWKRYEGCIILIGAHSSRCNDCILFV